MKTENSESTRLVEIVYIAARQMFVQDKTYSLAISAQIVGMNLTTVGSTPTQLLNIQVGTRNPQFNLSLYNISFYENTTGGSM